MNSGSSPFIETAERVASISFQCEYECWIGGGLVRFCMKTFETPPEPLEA